jgi:phosphoribosyl 1,2-cyclic phosphodiesterase
MSSLSRDPLVLAVLASGSRGNTTYIGDGRHGVLVDCGLSTRQLGKRLAAVGLARAPIDAVLVTHEHSDHVGAARVLSDALSRGRAEPLPFLMSRGTASSLRRACRPERIETVASGAVLQVGGLRITAHAVPHDAAETLCFTVATSRAHVAQVTDLGRPTRALVELLAAVDAAVVEFNHDVQMLMEGAYPPSLKERVRGPRGHLSNDQAGDLVAAASAGAPLRHVVLAHLSQDNNTPAKAHAAARAALGRAGRADVTVTVASQDTPRVLEVRRTAARRAASPAQMALFG